MAVVKIMSEKNSNIDQSKKSVVQGELDAVKALFKIREGRIGRWHYFLWAVALNFLSKPFDFMLEHENIAFNLAGLAINLVILYLCVSLVAKRFRDIGGSGWFAVPVMVFASVIGVVFGAIDELMLSNSLFWSAVVSIVFLLVVGFALLFWPGQKFDNKYGPYVGKDKKVGVDGEGAEE